MPLSEPFFLFCKSFQRPFYESDFKYVESHRQSGKCYLFFDEIQMLSGWQDACRMLRLYDYSLFITGSNSQLLSGEFVKELSGRYIKREHGRCSVNTIMKYLSYLEEAYIIESIKQYSTKTKKELSFYTKIYDADVALNSIRCTDNHLDVTHNFENTIYNELVYMGYDITVYNNRGKEVDFRTVKDNKIYYIQAAYSVAENKTYDREFSAFGTIDNLLQKIIITNDDIDYSTSIVHHIKFKDFLLMEDLY